MDPNAAAQQLLQNQKFVELFQRALGNSSGDNETGGTADLLNSMPKEGDPQREEWLRKLQDRLQEETSKETKKELEQVHSDDQGQWMFVLPEPGFCFKTNLAGGMKIFINVCQHARIAEPVPMTAEEAGEEVRYRIPISCGQARPDKDKSGRPCKVYDVIVNPITIERCGSDNEFRRFVAALCMQWIKQKSEPTLNADEFRNLNFKCKGKLEPQRIRLSTAPKAQNVMGDEIQLPSASGAATAPSQMNGSQGNGKLVQEVAGSGKEEEDGRKQSGNPEGAPSVSPAAAIQEVTAQGLYDWSTHTKPTVNPYFKDNVPAHFLVTLFLPGIQTIREVDVRVEHRRIACYYIDEVDESNTRGHTAAAPFLTATLDYPISEEVSEAKYVRKTNLLKLKVAVRLPDETEPPATKPARDVTEEEAEEQQRVDGARMAAYEASKAQKAKTEAAEAAIMAERRSYVENLSAVQSGDVPPVVREEVDAMPRDQLPAMLHRLEGRIRRGDSIDVLLEKLPEPMLVALINYIREKLSLEPRRVPKPADMKKEGEEKASSSNEEMASDVSSAPPPPPQEFNATKQAEVLFGIAFHNRYLFALD